MLERLKKFSWGYILIGVLLAAIGICFICMQDMYDALAIAMGIILAVVGIGFLISAFVSKERRVLFALKVVFGVICIVCGTVTALTRESAILVIANIFFLLLIVDGAFKLQLSIMSRRYSFYGWWVILSLSVAVVVCSFLMCKFTPENPSTLTVLSGILFTFDGVTNILSAFWSSALTRRMDEGDAALREVDDAKDEPATTEVAPDANAVVEIAADEE